MIAVIDYGAGNLRSIRKALEAAGAETVVTDDPAVVTAADAVVLPGVGHAGQVVDRLRGLGMDRAIDETVKARKPFLGICVGMQVLFDHQEEGNGRGLGVLPGRVRSIDADVKIPHMGWNSSTRTDSSTGETTSDYFYFVHSFIAEPSDPDDVVETTVYGEEFASVVVRDNVWGTQFHPEKSGEAGLALIRRFVDQVNQTTSRKPA